MNETSNVSLIFIELGLAVIGLAVLARDAAQWDWISVGFLCNPDRQSGSDHPCLWDRLAAGTKGQSGIAEDFCDCIIMFWVVSIVARHTQHLKLKITCLT